MTSRARWFVLAAVALLATAYVLPLWRVDLIAPQGFVDYVLLNTDEFLFQH